MHKDLYLDINMFIADSILPNHLFKDLKQSECPVCTDLKQSECLVCTYLKQSERPVRKVTAFKQSERPIRKVTDLKLSDYPVRKDTYLNSKFTYRKGLITRLPIRWQTVC